jgi:L,D-peptidoglycan transpeptidase YkuD (ErfK/YbiS/YcfS/YnhG family)
MLVTGNTLEANGKSYKCAVGKGGFSKDKREGDGCTPLGTFLLRECFYRPDKMPAPETDLPLKALAENDGWCDDPKSRSYNLQVKRPYHFSHEALWREDDVYDIIVPLGYNDDPVVPGKGSAIFMHVARQNYEPTEGCVALALADLLELLALCDSGTRIEINQN